MVSRTLRVAAASLVLIGLTSRSSQAQTSQTLRACYVTEVGALYLIALDGLADSCLSEDHMEVLDGRRGRDS